MKNKSIETREKLSAALKKLMAEKPLAKITIRELTEMTHIRRQSFYYYFEDIYDLLKWAVRQEAEKSILKHGNMITWQEAIMDIFSYVTENKKQCLCILDSENHEFLEKFFYDDLRAIFRKSTFPFRELISDDPEEQHFMEFELHYLAISLTALYENWARGQISESPEYILKALETTLLDQVRGNLQRRHSADDKLEDIAKQIIQIRLP